MSYYKIGDICVEWCEEEAISLLQDEFSSLFEIDADEAVNLEKVTFQGICAMIEIEEDAKRLHRTGGYELFQMARGKFLANHWAQCRFGYGFWMNDLKSKKVMPIYFNLAMKNQIPLSMVRFFSTVGLHSKLLQKQSPILHASYIDYQGEAILFTAPSQTGKSTQAELWRMYAGAEIINGDRVLLHRKEDGWYSYGYPCCGSSNICINRTLPLKAIVVLAQGPENKIEGLSVSQKVRALVSGIEVYPWDIAEIEQAFSLAQQIVQEVPIVKLICRPDADAVAVLRKYLFGGRK